MLKKRTPLRERALPAYSRGEEMMNMATHIAGGAMALVILVLSIVRPALSKNTVGIVSGAIYGSSMLIVFTVSSVYHGMRKGVCKLVMRIIDHCDIYFLIAGTYTPILLLGVRTVNPALAWTVFGLEWVMAALGVTLNAIDLKKYEKFSMICYLVMGWGVIFCLRSTVEAMTLSGFLWILGGGVAFSIGALLYKIGKKKAYIHSVFHIFVVLGAALQFVGIYGYVL